VKSAWNKRLFAGGHECGESEGCEAGKDVGGVD